MGCISGTRLPQIQEEIEEMINKTRQQIELLPKPPPTNAFNEVAKLIKDFDSSMRLHIEGVSDKEGIIQQIRIPCGRFRESIQGTAPEFRPFSKLQDKQQAPPQPTFLEHEEEALPDNEYNDFGGVIEKKRVIYVDEVHQRMEE